jgi:hypothetical protein
LDADLAVCAHCFVAAGSPHLAKLIVDAVHLARPDFFEFLGLAALDATITASLVGSSAMNGPDGTDLTNGTLDLVGVASLVIATVNAG